jgi:hypothetical protein
VSVLTFFSKVNKMLIGIRKRGLGDPYPSSATQTSVYTMLANNGLWYSSVDGWNWGNNEWLCTADLYAPSCASIGMAVPSSPSQQAFGGTVQSSTTGQPVPAATQTPVFSSVQLAAATTPATTTTPTSPAPTTTQATYHPVLTLIDTAQTGQYFVGDSFTVTITGAPPNQVVMATSNGTTANMGSTDAAGNFTLNGSWTASNAGSYQQTWYVGSTLAGTLSFSVTAKPVTTPTPAPVTTTTTPVTENTTTTTTTSGLSTIPWYLWAGGAAVALLLIFND